MKPRTSYILPLLFVILCNNSAIGQSLKQDDIIITAGYGDPYSMYQLNKPILKPEYIDYTHMTLLGPIYLKGEFAINKWVSIGLDIAKARIKEKYQDTGWYGNTINNVTNIYTAWSALFRVNHCTKISKKTYFYTGIGLGLRHSAEIYTEHTNTQNTYAYYEYTGNWLFPYSIGFECTCGVQHFFNQHIGVYTEAGIAKSLVQGGLVLKFNAAKKQLKS